MLISPEILVFLVKVKNGVSMYAAIFRFNHPQLGCNLLFDII